MIDQPEPRAHQHPETLDSAQCAWLLKCTPEQAEELARAGEIPGLKIGRGWLFVRADLLAFLAERARAEAAERRAKRAANDSGTLRELAVKPRRGRRPPPLPAPVPLR